MEPFGDNGTGEDSVEKTPFMRFKIGGRMMCSILTLKNWVQFVTKKKKQEKKRTSGDVNDTTESVKVKKVISHHKMRRITSELNLEESLPWHFEKGMSYHCISQGDVDSLTYLRVIVKQQKIKYLLLSTWCMSNTDIQELKSWIEKGYIEKMDFYVGEIFTSRYASEFVTLKDLCNKTGGRVALFRNHSKVMAGFGEKFDFVIESSANVNTNPRCEQTCITCDTDLALFYKEFYDGIKSYDHTFDDWNPVEL